MITIIQSYLLEDKKREKSEKKHGQNKYYPVKTEPKP